MSLSAAPQTPSLRPTAVHRGLLLALLAVALIATAACQPATGPERVTELRNTYEATLNNFNVIETPMELPAPEPVDGEEGAEADAAADDDAAGDAAAEAGDDEIVEEVPVRQDVMLDILLRKVRGGGQLDGVTVDVFHVDAEERDKANYRIFVETEGLNKGSRTQVSHILEDVDFATGDKFAVEVKPAVQTDQYDQYLEYSGMEDEGHDDGQEG